MAGSVQDTYSSIRAKVAVVIERQNMLVAKMEAVKEENAQLRATIESLRQEICAESGPDSGRADAVIACRISA